MRGGARGGAGRKPVPYGERKVRVSFSLTRDTKQLIEQLRNSGMDVNILVQNYVRGLAEITE